MPMRPFFSPMGFGTELIYTLIIVFFCFLVYFKTREIYNLTKHKGIFYFRNTFLFFGLAYASRLFLHLLMIGRIAFDYVVPRMALMPFSHLIVAYFSTMALLYLAYSLIWKKIKVEHFLIFANIIAIFIAVVAFFLRNPMIVSLIQLLLLLITLLIIIKKNSKKISKIKALYFLIALFWLLNLFLRLVLNQQ